MKLGFALVAVVGNAAAFSGGDGSLSVTGLVEDLPAPLSLATTKPRFSWLLDSTTRNLTQSSYQLIIATSQADADAGKGDVCDSGKVLSSSSTLVRCNDEPLSAGAVYWWAVQVSTNDGSSSPWMTSQRFGVGLQTRSDWLRDSEFIGNANVDEYECPMFRSPTFEVPSSILTDIKSGAASALLHVASIGFHEAFVNGVRLESEAVLLPSISALSTRVLSHTYDVAPMLLDGASNTVGLW
jgi:alpha-L-rhamnosidase